MKLACLIAFAIAICYVHAGAANAEDWCQTFSILSSTSVPYCSGCNRDRALYMNTDLSSLWVKCQQVETMKGCLFKPAAQWAYYTTNTSTCNICESTYYLNATTRLCVEGTQTSTGCYSAILDGSTVYCAACSAGYWPSGTGTCVAGTVANCDLIENRWYLTTWANASAGSASSACLEPKAGYEVNASGVVSTATLANCAQYYFSTCYRCLTGYVQTQSTATATSCVAYARIASVFTAAFVAIAAYLF